MGIWRVIGSTRLDNLAARSILVFNSTPRDKEPEKLSHCYHLRQWTVVQGLKFPKGDCRPWQALKSLSPSEIKFALLLQVIRPLMKVGSSKLKHGVQGTQTDNPPNLIIDTRAGRNQETRMHRGQERGQKSLTRN
eukprot:1147076-Pelagomonas_calceolata.AAC.1